MQLEQIAFTNRGKVKKDEAAKLIRELAVTYPSAVPKLGLLLALLQPPVVKAATTFAWVALACAKKDVRQYLSYVMCDGTQMVATDGGRLHAAPCTDKAPGLYDPKTGERVWLLSQNYAEGETPSGHPGKFPDWQRIVPPVSHRSMQDVGDLKFNRLDKDSICTPGTSWYFSTQFDQVVKRCNRISEGDAHVESAYLEGPNGERAVIMPLRRQALEKAGVI